MLDKIKQAAFENGMKLMGNPRVMKVVADPRVMNGVMKVMQLRGKLKGALDARAAALAKALGLATREEVATLKGTIRTLENTVSTLEKKVEAAGNSKGQPGTNAAPPA